MNMQIFSILFFLLISTLIIFNYKIETKTTLDMRKEQTKTSLRENAIKKSLEEKFESRATYTKKYKVESMCAQAGLKIKYGEYMLICVISSIILPLLFLGFLNNEYLAIVGLLLGFTIPSQVIAILKNRRVAIMDKQVGSFLQMVTERYSNTKEFSKALHDCVEDFKGTEPFYKELRDTSLDIQLGVSVTVALKDLANRTGSKYLSRMGDYYSLALKLGTQDARNTLLKQSYHQYDEDRKLKNELKMAISGPANEAYIMIAFIPITMIYNAFTNPDYIPFMTQTTIGKIGVAGIFAVIMGCLWVVNAKLSAPID